MNDAFNDSGLIDLISERHIMLRKICEKAWNDNQSPVISNSEWLIMARAYRNTPTIARIAKQLDITRQAAHKLVKKMEDKGLVATTKLLNNKEKCVQLTELGKRCYEQHLTFKTALEQKIADAVGAEQLTLLKNLLRADWGIPPHTGDAMREQAALQKTASGRAAEPQ